MNTATRFAPPTASSRFIGRCCNCRRVVSVDAPRDDRPAFNYGSGGVPRAFVRNGVRTIVASYKGTFHVACECGGRIDFARVHGIVDASVKCDGRCTRARGQSCTCECGGANHGAHYS